MSQKNSLIPLPTETFPHIYVTIRYGNAHGYASLWRKKKLKSKKARKNEPPHAFNMP